jgi:hypothetical protein
VENAFMADKIPSSYCCAGLDFGFAMVYVTV